jgi:hypothetical protein
MSTPPPSPPAVIGSGKPHTVSVAPGTHVASSQKARKPEGGAAQDLTARLKATLLRGEEVSRVRRGVKEPVAPAPASSPLETQEAEPASQASGLSNAIRQRIAQLRERNEAVGRELDRLPPAGKRAR